MKTKIRTYDELLTFSTFEERFEYLRLDGVVGRDIFGFSRYINQAFYGSFEWKKLRDQLIVRDLGCDLGVHGYDITTSFIVHHMNPITISDLEERSDMLLNPRYLICTVYNTHNAIHYGGIDRIPKPTIERCRNDTTPWIK